ncbi:hypothetical protein AVEN_79349-1 [Araneus ventricosus]|uniref:Uncharacterized protein n=1 Tax=Araneus ventricosus TaxID=182803 RepID=A0A4Y2HBU0_ARAVE|nr:hypothetical protein AVEN_79349-1 [Araneus ventricosus]
MLEKRTLGNGGYWKHGMANVGKRSMGKCWKKEHWGMEDIGRIERVMLEEEHWEMLERRTLGNGRYWKDWTANVGKRSMGKCWKKEHWGMEDIGRIERLMLERGTLGNVGKRIIWN